MNPTWPALTVAAALAPAGFAWGWRSPPVATPARPVARSVAGPEPGLPPVAHALSQAEWLAGHSADWRVARLKENPAVLVVEFPDLAAQGLAMNRKAALLEKADAPRDQVLDDLALALLLARSGDNTQTFYQGHDYTSPALAQFYALVQKQSQPLNAQELRLRRLLLAHGLLQHTPQGLRATGMQALITFTAVQRDDPRTPEDESLDERRREPVLRHEASHGHFFTRPMYARQCRRWWRETFTQAQREAFRSHLAVLGYDRHNEELMLNEAQAFVLHTPDKRAFHAALVGMTEAQLDDLRTAFWRDMPAQAPHVPRP